MIASIVDVQLVRIVVVWADVNAAMAGNQIHLPVATEVTCGKAQHGISIAEWPAQFFECTVSIALEVKVGAVVARGNEVNEAVVVEVFKLALEEESAHIHSATVSDVYEVACPIVFQKEDAVAVIGNSEVHVAIVVDVAEVGCPTLFVEYESSVHGLFGPSTLSIVDPKLVDATWVIRIIVYKLATF